MPALGPKTAPRSIGKYLLFDEIASGGMATVHLGRVVGPAGFSRTVAIKQMHPHYAREPEFAAMFLDEARLAARIHHPNVVATLDVVARGGELFIVMEYVEGETLARLARAVQGEGRRVPLPVAVAILSGALSGLHAAHEAKGERQELLSLVHRDVSPQNVLVGVDGVPRVLDFGIAKARARLESTQGGQIKGKLRYMSPEQIRREPLDRRSDIYAAGVVLWETLAGRRLFTGDDPGSILHEILSLDVEPPSRHAPGLPPELDRIVEKALCRAPEGRYSTALELAEALERVVRPASARELGAWVGETAGLALHERRERLAEIESSGIDGASLGEAEHAAPQVLGRKTRADEVTVLEASAPAPISLGAPAVAPRRGSRGLLVWTALLVLGGLAATFVAFRWGRGGPGSPEPEPERRTPTSPSAFPSPSASVTHEPAPIAAPASASAATATGPSATATARPTANSASLERGPSSAKKRANCSPPYVLEPDGTKRYKPECL
ncbi:MAG: serine/threonine-protein kinase [Polyangiaceae bacterium]